MRTDDRVFVEAEAFRTKARGLWDQIRHGAARSISRPARFHPVAGLEMFLNPERLSRHFRAAEQGGADGRNNHPAIDADELTAFEAGVRMKCNDALLQLKRQTNAALIGYETKLFAIDIPPAGIAIQRIEAGAERRFQTYRHERRDLLIHLRHDELKTLSETRLFMVDNRLGRGPKPLHPIGFTLGLLVLMIIVEGLANSAIFAPVTAFGQIGGFAVAAIIAACNVSFAFVIGMVLLRNWLHRWPHRRIVAGVGTVAAISLLVYLQYNLARFRALVEHTPDLPSVPVLFGGAVEWSLPAGALFVISLAFAAIALVDGFCIAGDPYPGYSAMARAQLRARQAFAAGLKAFRVGAATLMASAERHMQGLLDDARQALFTYQNLSAEFRSLGTLYEQNAHQIENACNRVIKDYREKNLFVRTSDAPAYFDEYLPLDWEIGREIGDPGARLERLTAAVDDMQVEVEDAKTRLHNLLVRHLKDIDDDLAAINSAAATLLERENLVFRQAAGMEV